MFAMRLFCLSYAFYAFHEVIKLFYVCHVVLCLSHDYFCSRYAKEDAKLERKKSEMKGKHDERYCTHYNGSISISLQFGYLYHLLRSTEIGA